MNKLFFWFISFFVTFLLWSADPSLKEKLQSLSNKELFELSENGTLGKIAREKTSGFLLVYQEVPFDLKTNQNYPEDKLGMRYIHVSPESPTWRVDRDLLNLFKKFKDNLLESDINTVMKEASKMLSQRKIDGKLGGLYYGFQFSRDGRDTRFYIEVDVETEKIITKIMEGEHYLDINELTKAEKKMIESGKLSIEEMIELKKIKLVSQIISSNSPFKDTPGGWANNKIDPRSFPKNVTCPFTAYCGEHGRTTLEFVNQMENRGYLKHFTVRNMLVRNHIFNDHAGIAIKNKRTAEILVLDSWAVKGGRPLKIIPLSRWGYWIMKGKREILNTCLESIMNQVTPE